jgi:FXSXX-COOH protein
MVTIEELRPASSSATVDLDGIPLSEILALGPDVLWGTIGRSLPGRTAGPVQVAAFQSAI